jgi:hypothetical protein
LSLRCNDVPGLPSLSFLCLQRALRQIGIEGTNVHTSIHEQKKGGKLGDTFWGIHVYKSFGLFDKNSLFGRLKLPRGELCVKEIFPTNLSPLKGTFLQPKLLTLGGNIVFRREMPKILLQEVPLLFPGRFYLPASWRTPACRCPEENFGARGLREKISIHLAYQTRHEFMVICHPA